MKPWLVVAAVTAALPALVAPSSAQAPVRSPEARATTPAATRDVAIGQSKSSVRAGSRKTRKAAGRARETSRPSAPPSDLPPGYHKVDHQTGLPNPSIPSR
jgi:hypothetical protein